MKVIITFTFCCDNLWKSKFMALEKPGKLQEIFSPILWPPCFSNHMCESTVRTKLKADDVLVDRSVSRAFAACPSCSKASSK